MKKLGLSACSCHDCSTLFKAPLLGDFFYGEFILRAVSGENRYLNAFDDNTYDELVKLIEENRLPTDVQAVYGPVVGDADSQGNHFYIGNPFCPNCQSTRINVLGLLPDEFERVNHLTHIRWDSFNKKQKMIKLLDISQQIKG